MSTQNPLLPEGAIPPSKGKSNVKIAIFTILAIHVVLLGGLLIQGCKPAAKVEAKQEVTPAPELQPATPTPEVATLPEPTTVPATPAPTPAAAPVTAPTHVASIPASLPVAASTPAPVADAVLTGDVTTHVVAKGEMLSTIAKKYHVSVKAIQDANPNANPTKLQIGQKLNIPAASAKAEAVAVAAPADASDASVYVVKSGDALEKIAKSNGTTVKAIKALNNLKTDRIAVGQKLKMPAGKAAASAEAASTLPATTAAVSTPAAAPIRTASR
jgi:LysM repeat protein